MNYAGNFDSRRARSISNQILTMRKATNLLCDRWPLSPDQRLLGKPLQALFQIVR